jgi:hypothetical protein
MLWLSTTGQSADPHFGHRGLDHETQSISGAARGFRRGGLGNPKSGKLSRNPAIRGPCNL